MITYSRDEVDKASSRKVLCVRRTEAHVRIRKNAHMQVSAYRVKTIAFMQGLFVLCMHNTKIELIETNVIRGVRIKYEESYFYTTMIIL